MQRRNKPALKAGVTFRSRHETIEDPPMRVLETTVLCYGREELRYVLTQDDAAGPAWYAGVSVRPAAEPTTRDPEDEVVFGPLASETEAHRLIAEQLAAHLAVALRLKAPHEPDPDLPDGGMVNHLLRDIKDARLLDQLRKTFDVDD